MRTRRRKGEAACSSRRSLSRLSWTVAMEGFLLFGDGGWRQQVHCTPTRRHPQRRLLPRPETQWHVGTLPQVTRRKCLGNQSLVTSGAACQPLLNVGRLAGTLPVQLSSKTS